MHSGGGVLSFRNVFSCLAPCAEGFGLRLAVRFGHGQESGLCLAFRLLEGSGVALGFRGGALGGLLGQRLDVDQFRQFVAFFNDDGRRSRGGCGLFRGVQLVQCQHKGGGFPVTADKVVHLLDHPINQGMENGVVLALVVEDLGGVLLCLFVVGAVAVVKAAVLCRVEGIELVKVDLCGLALCGQLLVIGHDLSDGAKAGSGCGLGILNLQAAEQVGFRGVEVRGGGGFLALSFGGFPLFLAGLRGVLPQIAGNEALFPGADALVQAVPLGDGVQFIGS